MPNPQAYSQPGLQTNQYKFTAGEAKDIRAVVTVLKVENGTGRFMVEAENCRFLATPGKVILFPAPIFIQTITCNTSQSVEITLGVAKIAWEPGGPALGSVTVSSGLINVQSQPGTYLTTGEQGYFNQVGIDPGNGATFAFPVGSFGYSLGFAMAKIILQDAGPAWSGQINLQADGVNREVMDENGVLYPSGAVPGNGTYYMDVSGARSVGAQRTGGANTVDFSFFATPKPSSLYTADKKGTWLVTLDDPDYGFGVALPYVLAGGVSIQTVLPGVGAFQRLLWRLNHDTPVGETLTVDVAPMDALGNVYSFTDFYAIPGNAAPNENGLTWGANLGDHSYYDINLANKGTATNIFPWVGAASLQVTLTRSNNGGGPSTITRFDFYLHTR